MQICSYFVECCGRFQVVEAAAQNDHRTQIIHLILLVAIGFGAMVRDIFSLPPAIDCYEILSKETLSRADMNETVVMAKSRHIWTITYAGIKILYIGVQVSYGEYHHVQTCSR